MENKHGGLPQAGCICKPRAHSNIQEKVPVALHLNLGDFYRGIGDKYSNVNLQVGTPQGEPDFRHDHEYFTQAFFVTVSYQQDKLKYFYISALPDGKGCFF